MKEYTVYRENLTVPFGIQWVFHHCTLVINFDSRIQLILVIRVCVMIGSTFKFVCKMPLVVWYGENFKRILIFRLYIVTQVTAVVHAMCLKEKSPWQHGLEDTSQLALLIKDCLLAGQSLTHKLLNLQNCLAQYLNGQIVLEMLLSCKTLIYLKTVLFDKSFKYYVVYLIHYLYSFIFV